MLALVAGALLCGNVGANELNNAGFEDPLGFDFSDTSNWNGFFGGPAGVFLEAFNDTGAPANSGSQALELTIEGNQDTNGFESFTGHVQTVPGVSEGDSVLYSVWARNNDSALTGVVEFRIEFRDASNVEISRAQIELQNLLTDVYAPYSVPGIAPAGTASVNAVLAVSSFNQDVLHDHSALFDDASLIVTRIPEPASAMLLALGLCVGVIRRRK